MAESLDTLRALAAQAAKELLETAKVRPGGLMVVGCSSSEVGGHRIGTDSHVETAAAIFDGIYEQTQKNGLFLAAQCCEHLNRALIIERDAAEKFGYEPVNVVPQPKAGGSFATTAYARFQFPVAVEHVRADCGLDIGGTLIGMHLKEVAVPVRLSIQQLGEAVLLCARTRPKFVGGARAQYDNALL